MKKDEPKDIWFACFVVGEEFDAKIPKSYFHVHFFFHGATIYEQEMFHLVCQIKYLKSDSSPVSSNTEL